MRLFKSFANFDNKIALHDGDLVRLSYKEVLLEINKIKKQIKKKSLVLIISENTIGSLLSYIFCIINNHVAIIVDSKTKKKDILKIFKNYKPNYIFLASKNKFLFKKKCVEKYNFFNEVLLKNKINKKIIFNKDLSLLLSTSGSMGSVKFAKLSRKNIKHNTDTIIKYLKINKNDTAITNLPISYSYMISIINTHFEKGGSIIISNYSLIEKKFWQIFKKNKITSFNGVPYTYEMLSRIGFKNIKINSLRYLTQAGGKLERKILNEINNFCKKNELKFFSMYGQTEASPRISYLKPQFSIKKIGSIGQGTNGNKIYLIDNNGKKIKLPFKEGEIVCEGKNVFMGYSESFRDLKLNNQSNYKLRTGDLGYFDNDGFFYITSRKNKIAKIFGNRIDLGALEDLMRKKDYKVVCLSDDKKIFIFTEKNYDKKKLIDCISKISNINIRSFELIKLKYLPRTSNNKISYNELKKRC